MLPADDRQVRAFPRGRGKPGGLQSHTSALEVYRSAFRRGQAVTRLQIARHSERYAAVHEQCDTHDGQWQAIRQVVRPVDWIDNSNTSPCSTGAAFFGVEAVARKALGQPCRQQSLHVQVHVRHEVPMNALGEGQHRPVQKASSGRDGGRLDDDHRVSAAALK